MKIHPKINERFKEKGNELIGKKLAELMQQYEDSIRKEIGVKNIIFPKDYIYQRFTEDYINYLNKKRR